MRCDFELREDAENGLDCAGQEQVVRDAVQSEPVSGRISQLNGNLQGKLHFLSSNFDEMGRKSSGNLSLLLRFPYAQNREFSFAKQGNNNPRTGIGQLANRDRLVAPTIRRLSELAARKVLFVLAHNS